MKDEEKVKTIVVEDMTDTIQIGDRYFKLGDDPVIQKELRAVKLFIDREKGHGQWAKLAINNVLLLALIGMNLCLPTKSR
jgi:hypothetical protein